jgi:hypothetical protein
MEVAMNKPTREEIEQWRNDEAIETLKNACLDLLDENERQAAVIEVARRYVSGNYKTGEIAKALAKFGGGGK